MKSFFSYFGGKWRAAPRYPAPLHDRIVEPFAGAAGYSTRYFDRDVVLIEKDPQIAELWRYLISAMPSEIESLPLAVTHVDLLDVPLGARLLIGFWLNKGTTMAHKTPSAWMRSGIRPRSFWGAEIRSRIASQVAHIKHWTIIEGEYDGEYHELNDGGTSTWFVDPPYERSGRLYRHRDVDYERLAAWCASRRGQVIVCEQEGASWLPFQPFATTKALEGSRGRHSSMEMIWCNSPWEARTDAMRRTK